MNNIAEKKFRRTSKSDAVASMLEVLRSAGRPTFNNENSWEPCLCALILALEPQCKTFRLLEALPYEDTAIDETGLMNSMANLGYYARHIETTLDRIDPRLMPCLFISDKGKPLVVLKEKNKILQFYTRSGDVKARKKTIRNRKGRIWVFERYDESKTATSKFMRTGTGQGWTRALLSRFSGTFRQVLLTGLVLNILALASPIFIMLVYDRVISAGSLETLPMLTVGVCLAIFFEWQLRSIRSRGLSWLAARTDNIVGNKIFTHLIGLPPNLIERASVSAQIARIKTFEAVRDFFSGSVFLSMLELPFTVLAALAIYMIAGPLVLVPLGVTVLYGLLFYVVLRKVKVSIRLAAKASSARQQFTMEAFEKIHGVRGYGLSDVWEEKFRALSGREMIAHFHLNWQGMVAETIANALTLMAAVATVAAGAHFIWAGSITTGALVATMILVWRVLTPFYSLCTMIPRLEQLRNSIIQVDKLMDIDTEAMEAKSAARLPRMQGRIVFLHVGLRYADEGDYIFSKLNFEARPGDIIVVSGDNGAGKTSLLKLIKCLYKAQEGSVQIDGFDIRQLDAPDLRRQIAYVPQQPDFFQGTILENLRFGNPLAGESDIQNALQLADAWEDVLKMPLGLNTPVSRYGVHALPSGFATRLSLARAYLHAAPILLIDELPNALLSSRAGKNLKDYLARTKGKRTSIMVTYREDFMALADTIVVLRRGEMPTVGSREDILGHQNSETVKKRNSEAAA